MACKRKVTAPGSDHIFSFFASGFLSGAGGENQGQELEQGLELQLPSTSGEGKDSSTEQLEKQIDGETGLYLRR